MIFDAKLADEAGRVAALRRCAVLDTPPEAPFERITDLVRRILDVPIASVSLIDAERHWFKSLAGLMASEVPRAVSFCDHTIRRRAPLLVPNLALDLRFASNPLVAGEPFLRSYLGVPLTTPDGYNIGALCAIDHVPRTFSTAQVGTLESFADLVMGELELRQRAASDVLTGALSRRRWIEAADAEIARCQRHGRDAAMVLFDLDHFKRINDTQGHAAGDMVLQTVARRCMNALRDSDLLGRLGGEEFAILLPETDAVQALHVAERMRALVADAPVEVEGALPITASFGVCPLQPSIVDATAWLAAADVGLYAAKTGGRDQCRMVLDSRAQAS